MKLLAFLLFFHVALIKCTPLDAAEDFELASREIENNNGHFEFITLPNGHHMITVYDDGKYQGAITEKEDGSSTIYDKNGKLIDLDDDSDDGGDEHKLRRRQRLALLRRFGSFIARWGRRAWVSVLVEFLDEPLKLTWRDPEFLRLRWRRHSSQMLGWSTHSYK